MAPATLGHATHRVHRHRLFAEDRSSQVAPVDALRGRAPRLLFCCRLLVMCWLGPDDWLSVTAGHQIQPLTDGRGAGVRCDALAPFDVVAKASHQAFHRYEFADSLQNLRHVRVIRREPGTERSNERLEGTPTLSLDRLTRLVNGAPVAELFNILQEHQSWPGGMGPTNNHPGQAAYTAVAGRAALGLAVVAAVRRSPEDANGLATGGQHRIDFKHVRHVV